MCILDTMDRHAIKQTDALSFIMGGNSLFTIYIQTTGKHYTFKVLQHHQVENRFKVMILNGPDNTHNYKEFGHIIVENGVPLFHKGHYSFNRDYAELFDIIFLNFSIGVEMPTVTIFHSGRCCRCGRLLTVPESIVSGIGPECAFKTSILKQFML